MSVRVVFDTNIVLSSLLFTSGQLAWLRTAWEKQTLIPVVTKETIEELLRVLSYPKFKLSVEERNDLLADYLPFAETFMIVSIDRSKVPVCRDVHDQKFLDLACQSKTPYLVTGDKDLLALNDSVEFSILTASELKQIIESG